MKKTTHLTIFTLTLTFISQLLIGQTMSLTAGIGSTHYIDILKDEHMRSEYTIGESYFLKVDFSNDQSKSIFSNFAFGIAKQSGDIIYSSDALFCGMGLPSSLIFTDENVEKYTLQVISYPLIYPIVEGIRLKTGFAVNKSFHFATTSNYPPNRNNDTVIFNSQINVQTFSADATFELQLGEHQFGNGITMIPVYNAFIGLTKEFEGGYNTHSIRQSIGLSFNWGLKKK